MGLINIDTNLKRRLVVESKKDDDLSRLDGLLSLSHLRTFRYLLTV
jgi:hypothetical protein